MRPTAQPGRVERPCMSAEAWSFVLGLPMGRGNGIRKLILLAFANHADKHGRGA